METPNGEARRNTTTKLPGGCTGKGFVKGFDPKRNLKGRPRSFDQARALAQQIVHQQLGESGLTVIEAIFRQWAKSPSHQRDLIEYAFGKVPDKLETTGLENKTAITLYFDHERGLTSDAENSKNPRVSSKVS
jgi:hypothetical protein